MPHKVSILMLTHNAPSYVDLAIRSLARHTNKVDYELVVVDNASEEPTRRCVKQVSGDGLISKLSLLDYNALFAGGNNIAARLARTDSTHLLLLNSDVEIRHRGWLQNLLAVHKPGITTYGVVTDPLRVDGYCLLIDTALYLENLLDEENHPWTWAVTKLQAAVLRQGYSVQGYAEHEKYLHHFGGKSGKAWESAKGLVVTPEQLAEWFGERRIRVLDALPDGSLPKRPQDRLLHRGLNKLKRVFTPA